MPQEQQRTLQVLKLSEEVDTEITSLVARAASGAVDRNAAEQPRTGPHSAVWRTKRCAVPGVASIKGLRPVIMERSLKVIDGELQGAGTDASTPCGARGNAL
jgi:hypothetical protein